MALVILSPGNMTRAKTRTLSLAAFLGLAFTVVSLVFCAGLMLGTAFRSSEAVAPAQLADYSVIEWVPATPAPASEEAMAEVMDVSPRVVVAQPGVPEMAANEATVETVDTAENKVLVERLGELTGRMIQLETEAQTLAGRIEAILEFEARNADSEPVKAGRVARTPPGMPSGGPLLTPRSEEQNVPRMLDRSVFEGSLQFKADGLGVDVAGVAEGMDRLAQMLKEIEEHATSFKLSHMSFPGRTPVLGVPINSAFGNRRDPFTRKKAFHSGVDFAAPKGTPILASAGGTVIYAGRRPHYGLTVEIEHSPGLVSRYAHASKLRVALGDVVMPQQHIADVGSTGRSSGPHLHFEVLKDGRFVDPGFYLARF